MKSSARRSNGERCELQRAAHEVEREVAELQRADHGLRARWQKEREAITRISDLKKQIETLRFEADEQTRRGKLSVRRRSSTASYPGLNPNSAMNANQDGTAARLAC